MLPPPKFIFGQSKPCPYIHYFCNSFIAMLYSSSFGALPCQSALFSIKETPFPFIVFAIIAVGFPFTVFAFSNACIIFSFLLSSLVFTSNPKLFYFSSNGYMLITSFTFPSICKLLLSTTKHRLSNL